ESSPAGAVLPGMRAFRRDRRPGPSARRLPAAARGARALSPRAPARGARGALQFFPPALEGDGPRDRTPPGRRWPRILVPPARAALRAPGPAGAGHRHPAGRRSRRAAQGHDRQPAVSRQGRLHDRHRAGRGPAGTPRGAPGNGGGSRARAGGRAPSPACLAGRPARRPVPAAAGAARRLSSALAESALAGPVPGRRATAPQATAVAAARAVAAPGTRCGTRRSADPGLRSRAHRDGLVGRRGRGPRLFRRRGRGGRGALDLSRPRAARLVPARIVRLMTRPLPAYAELHALSNFTFLRGASHPEELVLAAHELGYRALALTDECSVAGIVRAHAAAKDTGLRLIVGTEIRLAAGPKLVVLAQSR